MRRLFVKTLIGLGATLAITLCALTSQRLTEALRPALERAISTALGRSVTIGRLTVVALPPRVLVSQVEVGPQDSEGARIDGHVSIEQVRITPGIWPLLWARKLTLKEVDIVRPSAELTVHDGSSPGSRQATPFALPIDIRAVHLEDGQVNLLGTTGRAQAVGLQLDMRPTGFSGRAIAIELTQMSLHGFGLPPLAPEWTGEMHGTAALTGSLAQPKGLTLDALEVSGTGASATLSGDIELRGEAPVLRLGSELHVRLEELAPFVPQLHGWQGDALAQLTLLGTPSVPRLRAELVVEPLRAPSAQDLGQLRAQLEWRRSSVVLERVTWRPAGVRGHAALSGTAQLDLRAPYRVRSALKLDELSSEALWALMRVPNGPLDATCSGPVRIQGALSTSEEATCKMDVTCHDVTLLGRTTERGRARLLSWPLMGLHGSVAVQNHTVTIAPLRILSPGGPLGVTGRITWGGSNPPTVQLHTEAKALELDALGPIAGLSYGGQGHLEAEVGGAWPQLNVTMPWEAQGLKIGPVRVGESRGVLAYADGLLTLNDVLVTRPSGTLSGQARIALSAAHTPQLIAHMGVHGLEASELLFALGSPEGVARQLHARLWGQLHAAGELTAPGGRGVLKTPQLALGDVTLGSGELSLEFAEGERWVAGELRVGAPAGEVTAQATLTRAAELRLHLEGRRLPLVLWPQLQRNEVTGVAHLRLDVAGPLKKLTGEAHMEVPRLSIAGHDTGASAISATLSHPEFTVHASVFDAQLSVDGTGGVAAPHPVLLRAKMRELKVGELLALPALMVPVALREMLVTLSGEGELRGPLGAPDRLRAQLKLTQLDGAWRNVSVKLRDEVALVIARQRLQFKTPLRLSGPQIVATLRGSMPLATAPGHGAVALSLAADGDLALVQAWVKDIDAAHGPVRIRGTMAGSWHKPSLLGEMELRRGSMRWQKSDHTLEQISLRALFSGQAVAITQGSARLGRGTLRLTGEAAPQNGRLSELGHDVSLRLTLQHIPIEPASDVQAQVSGNLELTGGHAGGSLNGQLRIESLRYTARIDLDRLVPKRAAPPLRAPLLTNLPPLKLHVQVQAPNNLIVLSSVLESELSCDLTLTGTTARMGLLGSVTPLWARARWRNNTFVLSRANIDFVDEFRIAPQYSVRAHTEACHMQAEVLVEGSVDGFNVVPSGRDERGVVDPQDVLSCLQLGLRLRDFDGNQRGGATMDDALRSSLDALWTVSGLDDKVRKMLPIGVDELRLTSGWSSIGQRTTARVLVGKDLGKRVALRYSRSLDEYNDQAFSLDYRLAERATMQGNWVSTRDVPVGDLGLDLRLHWEVL